MKRSISSPGGLPKQLSLGVNPVSSRRWNIFLFDGSRMILAGTIALLIGLCVDKVLLLILLPIATSLYTYGVLQVANERRRGSGLQPWLAASPIRLDVWRRPRLPKIDQRSLPR